jgi:adenylate cyclase
VIYAYSKEFIMALEIERKFLVNTELLPSAIKGIMITQGYLHVSDQNSIRVRIAGTEAFITVKGPDKDGVRSEFEYPIPMKRSGEK